MTEMPCGMCVAAMVRSRIESSDPQPGDAGWQPAWYTAWQVKRQARPQPQMIVGRNAAWAPQAPSRRSEGLPGARSIHGRARGDLAESDQAVNDRLHLIGAQTFVADDA